MPIQVGSIANITVAVDNDKTTELGKQVLAQLAGYASACPSIKTFFQEQTAVTVMLRMYKGSGAVTMHKSSTIIVSKTLKGGAQEMAESALFELVNWSQGDFATREQKRLKKSKITPEQAGTAIARCEANSVYRHGLFLAAIKTAGIALSAYGEKQRTETFGKTLEDVLATTMRSAHDTSAPASDMMSLATPLMYWYQTINGVGNAEITIRAINTPPAWLSDCITKVFQYNDMLESAQPAELYVKLLNLAKLAKCTLAGGYEFTSAMKTVANEMVPLDPRLQMSVKSLAELPGAPKTLALWLKEAKLLS